MLKADANGLPVEASNTDTDVASAVSLKHTRAHAITSATDHTSGATEGKILKANASGLPIDASNTDTEVASAVTLKHTRSHAITSTLDHTSSATGGSILKADASGLPVSASAADIEGSHTHSKLVASDGSPNPAVSVDADGNVGINMPSPTANLHINAFGAVDIFKAYQDTDQYVSINNSGHLKIETQSVLAGECPLKVHTPGGPQAEFGEGTSIGTPYISIGRGGTNGFLDIAYDENSKTGSVLVRDDTAAALSVKYGGNVAIGAVPSTTRLLISTGSSTETALTVKGTGAADLVNIMDNTTEVFTIVDGGNVGIGATAPAGINLGAPTLNIRGSLPNLSLYNTSGSTNRRLWWIDVESNDTLNIGSSDDNTAGTLYKMTIQWDGKVGIGTTAPKSPLHVVGLPVYANNAAAISGGLTAGAFYRTGGDPDPVCVVH
jgi:hypothetical protein